MTLGYRSPVDIGLDVIKKEQQIARDKQAEEQQIRRDWESQIAAQEAAAKAQFEADLAAKKAEAQALFESQLTAAKSQADFDASWASQESTLRSDFQNTLAAERASAKRIYQQGVQSRRGMFREALGTAVTRAKIEAAMKQKSYAAVAPRLVSAYEKGEKAIFETALGAEVEGFEAKLTDWERDLATTFESGLTETKTASKAEYEKEMSQWETEQRAAFQEQITGFETSARSVQTEGIKQWRTTESGKLEKALSDWSANWQPKGLGEQILDVAASIGKPFQLSVSVPIPTPAGTLQVGFDVGKFFQGLAQGSTVAAAYVVGSGERLAYGVAEAIGSVSGYKIATPRAMPTVSGAGISSAILSITSGQAQWSQEALSFGEPLTSRGLGQFQFTAGAASILGDLLISYGVGKVAEKVVIQPLSQTRLGQYVGYQFKLHAPKLALRAVYGKSGAEYIIAERTPFYEGAIETVSPTGEVLQTAWKVPKSVEDVALSREILRSSGAGLDTDFPLLKFRGQKITPMGKTLAKAIGKIGEKKGAMTLLAPLETVEKVIHPALPSIATELQFGFTPITSTIPTAAAGLSLAAAIGLKPQTPVRTKLFEAPSLKQPTRLKRDVFSIPTLAEATGLEPWQEAKPAQAAVQSVASAVAQASALKLGLKMKLKLKRKEEEPLLKARRAVLGKKPTKRMAGYVYPVLQTGKVPKFLGAGLGRRQQKGISSASSFLLSRSRRTSHVFTQKRKPRK